MKEAVITIVDTDYDGTPFTRVYRVEFEGELEYDHDSNSITLSKVVASAVMKDA